MVARVVASLTLLSQFKRVRLAFLRLGLRLIPLVQSQAGKQHLNTGYSATQINKLGRTMYANSTQVSVTACAA